MSINVSPRLRLLKHTAKSYGVHVNVNLQQAEHIAQDETCAYCGEAAAYLGCIYPMSEGGPLVPANLGVFCRACRHRGNPFEAELEPDRLTAIHRMMSERAGFELVKIVARKAAGII